MAVIKKLQFAILAALASCAPSDERMTQRFQQNKDTIELLRTELCRSWGENGGTLSETLVYPELPVADSQRLQATLRQIGAENISVFAEGCGAVIQMWSGFVLDFSQLKMLRYGGFLFELNRPISDRAPCDCVEREIPLQDGWLLRFASYTWIS